MTSQTVYVSFPSSKELHSRTRAFISAVTQDPDTHHQSLLDQIPNIFIDEVLEAFFVGPMDATGMKGGGASIMHGLMNVVGKASRALASKVFSRVSLAEQKVLAEHFQQISLEKEGQTYCGYLLDAELANEAALMFESFRRGSGDREHVARVMVAIGDGTIKNFFDIPISSIKVGMVTRGLVSAGRATIEQASHSMNGKLLPDLKPKVRQRVLDYTEEMLREF